MDEECMVCHEPTGKAGRDEDSLYTPNGVGPFCEQCWDDAWPVMVPTAPDPALLALAFSAERWEADESVIVMSGVGPIGQTMSHREAHRMADWLNGAISPAIARLLAPDVADGAGG